MSEGVERCECECECETMGSTPYRAMVRLQNKVYRLASENIQPHA